MDRLASFELIRKLIFDQAKVYPKHINEKEQEKAIIREKLLQTRRNAKAKEKEERQKLREEGAMKAL